jgi:hypothetical protein
MLIRIDDGNWLEPQQVTAVIVGEPILYHEEGGGPTIGPRVIVRYGPRKRGRVEPVVVTCRTLEEARNYADSLASLINEALDPSDE